MSDSVVTDLGSNFVGSPSTASWHACTRVPAAAPDDLVSETLAGMRGKHFDSAVAVAVLDNDRFVGVVTIERMFKAPEHARTVTFWIPRPRRRTRHRPGARRRQAVHHGEPGLAVVDEAGRFRGLIAPQQLLTVLVQEHDEDLARLGGFLHSVESTRATSLENVARRLWHRLPWLLVGLLGAMLSAGLMAAFEAQLDANLAVAYFVLESSISPTLSAPRPDAGDSRSFGRRRIRRIIGREAVTGLSVGVLLGVIMLPVVALMTGDWMLAAVVAFAVLAASTIATVVALALPWLLHRLGKDPAFGSGPLARVIQDLLSIVIYLVAVTVLLT